MVGEIGEKEKEVLRRAAAAAAVAYRAGAGKTNPETRTEMSMAPYATCLCANKFLVRVPNRGEGIRRASRFRSMRKVAEGDGTGRDGDGERISCSAAAVRRRGRKAGEKRETTNPFALLRLFLVAYATIASARSFPSVSDAREEYCNHVLEEQEQEKKEEERERAQTSDVKRHYAPRYLGFLRNVRRGSRLNV